MRFSSMFIVLQIKLISKKQPKIGLFTPRFEALSARLALRSL